MKVGTRALDMLESDRSQDFVGRLFNVGRSTVTHLVNRVNVTGSLSNRPRSGAPRVTSVRQNNFIHQRHLHDRYLMAQSTADIFVCNRGRTISRNPVQNRLRNRGISCRRHYHGLILTRRRRLYRQQWVRNNRWRNWLNVIFSDESRFNFSNADDRTRIYRRRNERYADNCVFSGLYVNVRVSLVTSENWPLHFAKNGLVFLDICWETCAVQFDVIVREGGRTR